MRQQHFSIKVKGADNLIEYLRLNALLPLEFYYKYFDTEGEVDQLAHWSMIGIYQN